jgi:hypothetical protein
LDTGIGLILEKAHQIIAAAGCHSTGKFNDAGIRRDRKIGGGIGLMNPTQHRNQDSQISNPLCNQPLNGFHYKIIVFDRAATSERETLRPPELPRLAIVLQQISHALRLLF